MVRDHQLEDDDDAFMEPPPVNRVAGHRKDGEEMENLCPNLVNPVCDWLGEIYDPVSREFVIPGHVRLPLHEESILCTLGVPHGEIKVPYKARAPVEHLVGQFASGMTNLLRKLVEGWTTLSGSDGDVVARQFTSFVGELTHRPTGCRGPCDYNSSQELPDTQEDLFRNGFGGMDAGLVKDGDDDMENVQDDILQLTTIRIHRTFLHQREAMPQIFQETHVFLPRGGVELHRMLLGALAARGATASGRSTKHKQAATPSRASARLNKGAPTTVGIMFTRSSPPISSSNTGDPFMLEDLRKTSRNCYKRPTRRHSLEVVDVHNVEIHKPRVEKPVIAPSIVAASSDARKPPSLAVVDVHTTTGGIGTSGSNELVSIRTAEIVPTLLAMRDVVAIPIIRSSSDEVDAPDLNLNKEDSRSSATDSMRGSDGTVVSMKEGDVAEIYDHRASIDNVGITRSPHKNPPPSSSALELLKSRAKTGFVSASTLFPPFAQSKAAEMIEVCISAGASGKQCTNEGDGNLHQTASFTAEKNPSLNHRTSKLHKNTGVSYSPNKKIAKKVVTKIPDSTPRPTNKVDACGADENDMFVHLSPLDSAKQFIQNLTDQKERHPMGFSSPSCSLGIDGIQAEPPIDPLCVAFAFPTGTVSMMAQPIADGRKVVSRAYIAISVSQISPNTLGIYRRKGERVRTPRVPSLRVAAALDGQGGPVSKLERRVAP
ncbi:hypothetical protein ZWY2020_054648 [Hordeum vulgare]|nr:hypothetical protein ZWY2020_054648 [Hordeum vulgare]